MPHKPFISRKQFPTVAGLSTLGAVSACTTPNFPSIAWPSAKPKKRILRIAHLTDFHMMPMEDAPDSARNAIRHAQAQIDPPDMLLDSSSCLNTHRFMPFQAAFSAVSQYPSLLKWAFPSTRNPTVLWYAVSH